MLEGCFSSADNSNIRTFEHSNIAIRSAFSLIELLVVIGIIGILGGVLFASFGGATESARAAQCLTNLRALAQAANAYACASNYYPTAGSVEVMTIKLGGSAFYWEKPGWVSWLSEGNYDDGNGNAVSSSHQSNEIFPFYGTGDDSETSRKNADYALRHGALWPFCAGKRAIYTCPEHVRYRKEHGGLAPHFSYVMNARFGWDTSKGSGSVPGQYIGIKYGTLSKADKTLMFAELPTVVISSSSTEEESNGEPTELKADCVLQYLKQSKDSSSYASEGTDAESIGFVHKSGKKRCAHVAFADGHTEKLVWREGGLTVEDLTAYLCRGIDVVFGTTGWTIPEGVDE